MRPFVPLRDAAGMAPPSGSNRKRLIGAVGAELQTVARMPAAAESGSCRSPSFENAQDQELARASEAATAPEEETPPAALAEAVAAPARVEDMLAGVGEQQAADDDENAEYSQTDFRETAWLLACIGCQRQPAFGALRP